MGFSLIDALDPLHIIHGNDNGNTVKPKGPMDGITDFFKENEGILEISALAFVALMVVKKMKG